jgi:hypothetical protein
VSGVSLREGAFEFVQGDAALSPRFNTGLSRRDWIASPGVVVEAQILSAKSGTNTPWGPTFYTSRNSGSGVERRREDLYGEAPPVDSQRARRLPGHCVLRSLLGSREQQWQALAVPQTTASRPN